MGWRIQSRARGLSGAFLLALSAAAVPAAARELRIERFSATIEVHSNATLDVNEVITARFIGYWNGIYRTIPIEYTGTGGFAYTLFLDPVSVTDEAGSPLKYEISRDGSNKKFKIWIPGVEDTTRTVALRYRVENGLRFFEDHDELYWNITGDSWEVPIQDARARIELPANTTGIRTRVFTGAYGSRASDADVNVAGTLVEVQMRRPLDFHEGLTAVVGWDKGTVIEPGWVQKTSQFTRSNWPLGIPVIFFVGMLGLWYQQGRDPKRQSIAVQYEPPASMSPAEAGALVQNSAQMRDITATIVDLAVQDYLSIEQVEKDEMLGLLHNRKYVFHRKKPGAEWASARPHEREILDALFEGGSRDAVSLADLENHFYTHLPKIRDGIFDALLGRGYYLHRPDMVRQGFLVGGLVLGIIVGAGGNALTASLGLSPLTWIVAGILTTASICGFGWYMPARTAAGARAQEGVLGFEEFLNRVDEPRFAAVIKTPEMFEKFLPFAMALGVEKRWVRAFADICHQPPSWYSGPYGAGFQPIYFVNDLDAMSARAGSVLSSAPRSAGSSGFGGGGGFSGGGFGGGGGGGF